MNFNYFKIDDNFVSFLTTGSPGVHLMTLPAVQGQTLK